MKLRLKNILLITFLIFSFFTFVTKINAACGFAEIVTYYSTYGTQQIPEKNFDGADDEYVNVRVVPKSSSTKYRIYSNNKSGDMILIGTYDKVETKQFNLSLGYVRTIKIKKNASGDGEECTVGNFNSYGTNYEINQLNVDDAGKNLIVAGYAFIQEVNKIKKHCVDPQIDIVVTNSDVFWIDAKKVAADSYIKKRCSLTTGGTIYKCNRETVELYSSSNYSTNELLQNRYRYKSDWIYNYSNATKVNPIYDFSYSRYFAEGSWGSKYFKLNNGTRPEDFEYYYLFNLNKNTYDAAGNIGANLQYKYYDENNNIKFKQATRANAINYFLNYKYDKFYINPNFYFFIPLDQIRNRLNWAADLNKLPKLKFQLIISTPTAKKIIYGTEVQTAALSTRVTQISVLNNFADTDRMKDILDDYNITFGNKVGNNISATGLQTKVQFLSVSTMRGRLYNENTASIYFYRVDEGKGTSPFFANSYSKIDGKYVLYHDATGDNKYQFTVDSIKKFANYYPINLYLLKVSSEANTKNYVCKDRNGSRGISRICMIPNESGKKIYALSTWIKPAGITTFNLKCRQGYVITNTASTGCCPEADWINDYPNKTKKTCCTNDKKVTNYASATKATECCQSGLRTVSSNTGNINLCGEICQAPLFTCPSTAQKDIKGKCCTKGKISSATGECTDGNEVEGKDKSGAICKLSDAEGCECPRINKEYSCTDKEDVTNKDAGSVTFSAKKSANSPSISCTDTYLVSYNKKMKIYQGYKFDYPVKIVVQRICNTNNTNNFIEIDNDILSAVADPIKLKNITVNATQEGLPENTRAKNNKKQYEVALATEEEIFKIVRTNTTMQRKEFFLEYREDYYINYQTGEIKQADLITEDDKLFSLSGRYIYLLRSAPVSKENDNTVNVKIKLSNIDNKESTIKISCPYDIVENKSVKYYFRQIDLKKPFPRTTIGENWKTDEAKKVIQQIKVDADTLYNEDNTIYEININSDTSRKLKDYINDHGYYDTTNKIEINDTWQSGLIYGEDYTDVFTKKR